MTTANKKKTGIVWNSPSRELPPLGRPVIWHISNQYLSVAIIEAKIVMDGGILGVVTSTGAKLNMGDWQLIAWAELADVHAALWGEPV